MIPRLLLGAVFLILVAFVIAGMIEYGHVEED